MDASFTDILHSTGSVTQIGVKKKLRIFQIKILFIVLELQKQIVSTWNYKTSLGYSFLKRFFKG